MRPSAKTEQFESDNSPPVHAGGFSFSATVPAHTPGWPRLETGPRHQQNCTDCHKENARPVRSEPQASHAASWRLQSVATRPEAGGARATKRSAPDSRAYHV